MYDVDVFYEELESLTGKVFKGDITPVVFNLLKTGNHVEELLRYLRDDEEGADDYNNTTENAVRKESNNRPCFEEWFSNAEQL